MRKRLWNVSTPSGVPLNVTIVQVLCAKAKFAYEAATGEVRRSHRGKAFENSPNKRQQAHADFYVLNLGICMTGISGIDMVSHIDQENPT